MARTRLGFGGGPSADYAGFAAKTETTVVRPRGSRYQFAFAAHTVARLLALWGVFR